RARARYAIPADALPERSTPLGDPGDEHIGLWQAVAELPERQRAAVAYHYLGGFSHVETAELIGGSPASVRRAPAAGIKRLKQNLFAGQTSKADRHLTKTSPKDHRRRTRTPCSPCPTRSWSNSRSGSEHAPTSRDWSMSPTVRSTPRSERCCWRRPGRGWYGSPSSVKASSTCCRRWRTRSVREC